MEKQKKGKPVNFVLSEENQELMEEYRKKLPSGTDIKPSAFYNKAVGYYLMIHMPSNQE